jgi:hypothetical protein
VAAALLTLTRPLLRGPLAQYRAVPAAAVATAMLRAGGGDGGGVRVHEAGEMTAAWTARSTSKAPGRSAQGA